MTGGFHDTNWNRNRAITPTSYVPPLWRPKPRRPMIPALPCPKMPFSGVVPRCSPARRRLRTGTRTPLRSRRAARRVPHGGGRSNHNRAGGRRQALSRPTTPAPQTCGGIASIPYEGQMSVMRTTAALAVQAMRQDGVGRRKFACGFVRRPHDCRAKRRTPPPPIVPDAARHAGSPSAQRARLPG